MAYNTSIVTATGGDGQPNLLAFSDDWMLNTHVDTALRVYDTDASVYRSCWIREVRSSRLCRVVWDGPSLPMGKATPLWEEQAVSVPRGFARSVCVYQQRLVLGGTRDAGNLLLMSKSGQFRNFDQGTAKDSDAIAVVGLGGVRTIMHVIAGTYLTILTDNGVSIIEVDALKALTPTTIRFKKIAPFGASNAAPAVFDGGVLMTVAGGVSVRDIAYSAEADNAVASPVSLAATGFLGGVVDAAHLSGSNARPEQLAFFVNAAGRIVLFHSIREQKVGAWFEWSTTGAWTSVAICGQNLFAVVQRNGTYRLEQFDFAAPFDASARFGPQAATLPIPCAQLPAGTAHAIDSAGDYLGSGPVTAGTVTVQRQTSDMPDLGTGQGIVGMAFGWWIDPLPPAVDLPDGTMIERFLRVISTSLKLAATQAVAIEGDALVLQADGLTVGGVPPAAERWWRTRHLGWARPNGESPPAARRITRNVPLPVTVLAMKREVRT